MRVFTFLSVISILSVCGEVESRRVVCYFINWAVYREGDGRYTPDQLDASKCTNVLYAFASLGDDSATIRSSDPNADENLGFYQQVVEKAKQANAKPSLSLGGWSDSAGTKYSVLLNDEGKRSQFVSNAVAYLERYGFEGLDLDIEYPTCPQGRCDEGNPNDKDGFAALIRQLSDEFKPKGWVLSAAIGANPDTIDRAYDIDALNEHLDWIGVMTYDYHSSTGGTTAPISPLQTEEGDQFPDSNTKASMEHLVNKGADKSKLLVGVPFYGYSYKLQDPSQNGYWAPTNGAGSGGPVVNTPGQPLYFEICDLILNQGYNEVENDALGAYAYKDDNWISFNSKKDALNKVNYIKEQDFGGALVWDLSNDDFNGKYCRSGNYPLLSTIKDNID